MPRISCMCVCDITPWTILRMPPWAHSSTLTLCLIVWSISKGDGYCDTSVRTQYVLRSLCPFHTWLRLLSPHILYSTHSTLCLFTSYHHFTLCWCFTLVVNHLLTTIAHHIFSSVLAEPHLHPSCSCIFITDTSTTWVVPVTRLSSTSTTTLLVDVSPASRSVGYAHRVWCCFTSTLWALWLWFHHILD